MAENINNDPNISSSPIENINNITEEMDKTKSIFNDLTDQLGDLINESNKTSTSLNKIFSKIGSNLDTGLKRQIREASRDVLKFGADATKELQKTSPNFEKISVEAKQVARVLSNLTRNNPILAKTFEEIIHKVENLEKQFEKNITTLDKFNKKINELSPKLGKTVGGTLSSFQDLFKGGVLALFLDSLFAVNQQTTDLQKNLGISSAQSQNLRAGFAQIAANADDVFINSTKIQKAFTDFSAELGGAVEKSGTMLETFANLTGRFGLNNQEAAKLTSIFGLQSRDTEQVFENTIKTINASRSSGKEFLNTREIIKDISNVSSSVIASLGKSPDILARAATRARELGLNLDQVEKIADSLLNFESSISAELTAELLTGKQLNLERARFLALNNDIKGLMEEINKQGINFTEFTKMNRIAQEALANTLGMSRAEMTEMLFKQEKQGLQIKANRGELDEQTLAQFKALSAQEKFNLAVEKAQAAFADLVIVLTPLLNLISKLAEWVGGGADKASELGATMGTVAEGTKQVERSMEKAVGFAAALITSMLVYKGISALLAASQAIRIKQSGTELTLEIGKTKAAAVRAAFLNPILAAAGAIAAGAIVIGLTSMFAARAKGGPITAGKPYLVGEEGPELIVPDSSGQVINNNALNALTSPSSTINMQPLIDRLDKLERTLVEYRSVPVVIENNIDGRELNKNTINGLRKGYLTTPSVYA
jgi:ABC-type transporter Mla subunit MlaD/biotin operon repressor